VKPVSWTGIVSGQGWGFPRPCFSREGPVEPRLATDASNQCCILDDETGERCPKAATQWVGDVRFPDDYTHVCDEHLADVQRPQDKVFPMWCKNGNWHPNGV
jgi:hypothetical protein